jgi:hypothetical protein
VPLLKNSQLIGVLDLDSPIPSRFDEEDAPGIRNARAHPAFFRERMTHHLPKIVAVSGLSSNTGKTTLACELIQTASGWEAIKLTRGHYRSCGQRPERLLCQRSLAR